MIHIDLSSWPLHLINHVSDTWNQRPSPPLRRGGIEGLGRMLKRMRKASLPVEIFLDSEPSASSQVADDNSEPSPSSVDADDDDWELDSPLSTCLAQEDDVSTVAGPEDDDDESTVAGPEEKATTHWVIRNPFSSMENMSWYGNDRDRNWSQRVRTPTQLDL
jgi:hypothetical protein